MHGGRILSMLNFTHNSRFKWYIVFIVQHAMTKLISYVPRSPRAYDVSRQTYLHVTLPLKNSIYIYKINPCFMNLIIGDGTSSCSLSIDIIFFRKKKSINAVKMLEPLLMLLQILSDVQYGQYTNEERMDYIISIFADTLWQRLVIRNRAGEQERSMPIALKDRQRRRTALLAALYAKWKKVSSLEKNISVKHKKNTLWIKIWMLLLHLLPVHSKWISLVKYPKMLLDIYLWH